tara:strand:+ start:1567 stop:1821 length:255 start_codon:yes stop_codon:yes gene_type:complete
MSVLVNEIQVFATKFGVPPAVAMMLPAVFNQGAEEVGMTTSDLVKLATYGEEELGHYVVTIAEEAANSELGKEVWAEFEEKENG